MKKLAVVYALMGFTLLNSTACAFRRAKPESAPAQATVNTPAAEPMPTPQAADPATPAISSAPLPATPATPVSSEPTSLAAGAGPDIAATKTHESAWSYSGATGPALWGELKSEYALCKDGKEQSPVDLKWRKPIPGGGIKFDYQPSKLRLIDNGHTLQVNFDPGSTVMIGGKSYELLQAHFHSSSEHTLSGQSLPIEWHFVHKSADGELAVIGVFMIQGAKHAALEKVLEAVPPVKEYEMVATEQMLAASDFLPARKTYYTYRGSLTTPPCTEGVLWNVLNTPITASGEQILKLRSLYSLNARPVQPLNGRKVLNH